MNKQENIEKIEQERLERIEPDNINEAIFNYEMQIQEELPKHVKQECIDRATKLINDKIKFNYNDSFELVKEVAENHFF